MTDTNWKQNLTKNRNRHNILKYIISYRALSGYSPSLREIARGCDIKSDSTVRRHLDWLRSEGLIEYKNNVSRSVMITSAGRDYVA